MSADQSMPQLCAGYGLSDMALSIEFNYGHVTMQGMDTMGKRLAALRKAREINQTDLAKTIGVNQSMISDYETRDVICDALKLAALAEELHTTMDYIVYGEQDTADEANLVGCFRAMPADMRATLLKSAQAFAANRAAPSKPFAQNKLNIVLPLVRVKRAAKKRTDKK